MKIIVPFCSSSSSSPSSSSSTSSQKIYQTITLNDHKYVHPPTERLVNSPCSCHNFGPSGKLDRSTNGECLYSRSYKIICNKMQKLASPCDTSRRTLKNYRLKIKSFLQKIKLYKKQKCKNYPYPLTDQSFFGGFKTQN